MDEDFQNSGFYGRYKNAFRDRKVSHKRPSSYSIANLKSVDKVGIRGKEQVLASFNHKSSQQELLKHVRFSIPNIFPIEH